MRPVVPEDHFDRIADFRVEDRPDDAEIGFARRTRLQMSEGSVGVLAIHGLAIDFPDRMRPSRGVRFGVAAGHAHVQRHAGHVVPVDLVGCDIVAPHHTLLLLRGQGRRQQHGERKKREKRRRLEAKTELHREPPSSNAVRARRERLYSVLRKALSVRASR